MNREDFPQLSNDLAYLDNAATTFKPKCVIDELDNFYRVHNANAKRGLYRLSYDAEQLYEKARCEVADFINANSNEIVFTRGATESLNMVAFGLDISNNDEVVVSITEHHSNMLPWRKTKGHIKYLYCEKDGSFSNSTIKETISERTRIVAITAYSNILGKNMGLSNIIKRAHEVGAIVVVDATQAIAHEKIDVKKIDADFLVFSGHKIYGPMGIGILYGKINLLEKLSPLLWGGEMVDDVTTSEMTLSEGPSRLEAGTMNIAGAIGLARALRYLKDCDLSKLLAYEKKLSSYAFKKIGKVPYLELAGARTLNCHSSILCFWLRDVHSHDISTFLDSRNIATRAGYQCAQPLIDYLGNGPVVRVSLSFYNSFEEIDRLSDALRGARRGIGLNE